MDREESTKYLGRKEAKMTTSAEMILIGGVINCLRKVGSWCGETHVQKCAYLAKVLKGVPLEAEFVLYKHGPYSFDLNKSIGHMLSRSILYSTPQGAYGPSLSINEPMLAALNAAAGQILQNQQPRIEAICQVIGKKKVVELERIATAVFVQKNYPTLSLAAKIQKLSELKPHIDKDTAALAFKEAEPLLAA